MNLEEYVKVLQEVEKKLTNYDSNKADSDYNHLREMFHTVYTSGVLDITHLEKKSKIVINLNFLLPLRNTQGLLLF